jgi:hypothetical protein
MISRRIHSLDRHQHLYPSLCLVVVYQLMHPVWTAHRRLRTLHFLKSTILEGIRGSTSSPKLRRWFPLKPKEPSTYVSDGPSQPPF